MGVGTADRRVTRLTRRRIWCVGAFAVLALAVLAFTGGWSQGRLTLDGPGVGLWLEVLLRHWHAGHAIPAWLPDMWAGAPVWNLAPVFPVLVLLPLAEVFGVDHAVRIGLLAGQVAGAWGAFVLARSLWSRWWPSVAAGLFYGLHPLFAASALNGHEHITWVFAATPWLAWTFPRALRGESRRHIVLSGILIGFVLAVQAELAYGLVLLCALLAVVELTRSRRTESARSAWRGVVGRAGAVVLIGLGTAAHWLLPFLVGSEWFVLTPREDVTAVLDFISNTIGRAPGSFLDRADPIGRVLSFDRFAFQIKEWEGTPVSCLYLSVFLVVLTLFTILRLARRPEFNGTLSAILLASGAGIWLSMGNAPLASSDLNQEGRVFVLMVMGVVGGLLLGNFLRAIGLRRAATPVKLGAALLLLAVPFVGPIDVLARLMPFAASIRSPRLFTLAALGVALGAAYPLTLIEGWARTRQRKVAPLLGFCACVALVVAFLIDVAPYRSFYRARPPDQANAYREMARTVALSDGDARVATECCGNPQLVAGLLETGRLLSVGWPHPIASKDLWRLTVEAAAGPTGYGEAAYGLSSTAWYKAHEVLTEDEQAVETVRLTPNPRALPLVRAYDQVVVAEERIAPELGVSLAGRYIGVVTGGSHEARMLRSAAMAVTGAPGTCDGMGATPPWAGDLAMACALNAWVGVRAGQSAVPVSESVGGAFRSTVGGLRGVTVWLHGPPGPTELVLHEVAGHGFTVGPEVRRTQASDVDDYGMTRFSFDAVPDSAGRRYLFLLSCPACSPAERPYMFVTGKPRRPGALVIGDRVDTAKTANFTPVYDELPPAEPPAIDLRASRPGPGKWQIEVSSARPSLVVVAESHFPGWEARVDGKKQQVVKADGAFVGTPVGAGSHEVTFEYHRSAAFPVGFGLTALTLLLSAALVVRDHHQGHGRAERSPTSSR